MGKDKRLKPITPITLKAMQHQRVAKKTGLQAIAEEYDNSLRAKLGIINQPEHLTDDVEIADGENGIFPVERK